MEEIQMLKAGKVGIVPTDTLYGLSAGAFDAAACARIYALKGRDEGKPFIILIADMSDLSRFGIELTAVQKSYLDTVWPGPVSVILPCPHEEFTYLHRGTTTLAFRLPILPELRALLRETGPLVAPSANPQGLEPAHTLEEARAYFGDRVDFYIEGGRKDAKPSTIISLASGVPVVIRP